MNLNPLFSEELQALPLGELINRMDAILQFSNKVDYKGLPDEIKNMFPSQPAVLDLVSTIRFKEMEEVERRRLVDAAFRFFCKWNFQLHLAESPALFYIVARTISRDGIRLATRWYLPCLINIR